MGKLKLDLMEIGNEPGKNRMELIDVFRREELAIAYSEKTRWQRIRRNMVIFFLIGCIIGIVPAVFHIEAVAGDDQNLFETPQKVECTYYLATGNPCANGLQPHVGVVAFAPEYIGDTAILYECKNGKICGVIGIYEIYDTGFGKHLPGIGSSIRAGKTVDVFMPDSAAGNAFINEHGNEVFIQIVKANG